MWNSLNSTIRNVDTLSKFKSELKNIDETENQLYFYGPRKLNIISRPKKKPCVFTVTRPTLIFASDPMNFYTEFDNHFCCLTSSNVLFIQLLAFCRNREQRR